MEKKFEETLQNVFSVKVSAVNLTLRKNCMENSGALSDFFSNIYSL